MVGAVTEGIVGCGIAVTTVGVGPPLTGRVDSVLTLAETVEVRVICGVGMGIWTGCSTGDVAWALDERDRLPPFSPGVVPEVEGPTCCAKDTADSLRPILFRAAVRPDTTEGPGLLIGCEVLVDR